MSPTVAPSIDGMNMKTGAQDGFFGPTNKENSEGAIKHNFFTGFDEISRPAFEAKRKKSPKSKSTTNKSPSETAPRSEAAANLSPSGEAPLQNNEGGVQPSNATQTKPPPEQGGPF